MPKVSAAHYEKMKAAYRLDVAKYIADAARDRRKVTYTDLKTEFGIIARGWGDILGGIAIRCSEAGLPLLPVIVVRIDTQEPSTDAVLYQDLGLETLDDIRSEQERCFAFDWRPTILGKS